MRDLKLRIYREQEIGQLPDREALDFLGQVFNRWPTTKHKDRIEVQVAATSGTHTIVIERDDGS